MDQNQRVLEAFAKFAADHLLHLIRQIDMGEYEDEWGSHGNSYLEALRTASELSMARNGVEAKLAGLHKQTDRKAVIPKPTEGRAA